MKQPEEMPSIKCPHENAEHGRCQNCGIEVIITPYDEQPRADLAAEPDKVDVDVEALKLAVAPGVRHFIGHKYHDETLSATIDYLYSRNLIPPVEPVRGDAEQFKDIMWAEKKVDVYSGDNCDEHKPFWWGYAEGDKQDGDIDDPLTLSLSQFPAGTKITISVPICPNCDLDRDFTNKTATPEMCECGFNWKGRDDEKYS